MPRVLTLHTVPVVTDCANTFANDVSTSPPYDNNVYAYAVIRVMQHVLDGWPAGSAPYPVRFVEIGNEPDALNNFWSGSQAQFVDMYIAVANALATARAAAPALSAWKQLRIGGGSFALAPGRSAVIGTSVITSWVPYFLARLDAVPTTPLEFLSVHSYHDQGPDIVIDEYSTRLELLQASHSLRYVGTEQVPAEWGPDLSHLGDFAFNHSMSAVLVHAFGLAGAHALRFRMTHKAIFYDYLYDTTLNGGFSTGLMDYQVQPSPNARVYQLFRDFMNRPRIIDLPALYPSGGSEGIVIAGIDAPGTSLQVLAVNAQTSTRNLSVSVTGYASFQPTTADVSILDGDASAIRTESAAANRVSGYQRVLPPRSVTLVRLH